MFIKSKKEKDTICELKGLLDYLEMSRDIRKKTIMSDNEIIYGEIGRERTCMLNMKNDLDLVIKKLRAIVKDL